VNSIPWYKVPRQPPQFRQGGPGLVPKTDFVSNATLRLDQVPNFV
jgi:hypothetical protein